MAANAATIRPLEAITGGRLWLAFPRFDRGQREGIVLKVWDDLRGHWGVADEIELDDGRVAWLYLPDHDRAVGAVHLAWRLGESLGLFGLGGVGETAVRARQARRDARAFLAGVQLEAAQTQPQPPGTTTGKGARCVLEPDRLYRLDVAMAWTGRLFEQNEDGTRTEVANLADQTTYRPAGGADSGTARSFYFATTPKPSAGALVPITGLGPDLSFIYLRQDSFNPDMLARHLAGYTPAQSEPFRFCDDPLQAHFTVAHVASLAAAYGYDLRIGVRRVDAPGAEGDPKFPLTSLVAMAATHLLRPADRLRVDAALRAVCPMPLPGATLQALEPLVPQAWYEVFVDLPGAGGLADGRLPGTTFRTSRWRSPGEMVTALGFGPAPAPATGDVVVTMVADLVTGDVIRSDADFQRAMDELGLDGWPVAEQPRTSLLWTDLGDGAWGLFGLLVESPEPVIRPGRCDVLAPRPPAAPRSCTSRRATGPAHASSSRRGACSRPPHPAPSSSPSASIPARSSRDRWPCPSRRRSPNLSWGRHERPVRAARPVCRRGNDDPGRPDLPDATHVRVVPSPLIGFPIAPLELFRVPADDRTIEAVLWRDRDGTVVPSGDLEVVGGYLTAEWEPGRQSVDVAVQVDLDETFEGTVSLLDPVGDRVLAQVSAEPFVVAGPRVSRLRIEGRASGPVGLRAWTVSDSIVREVILGSDPVDRLSLPVDGDRAWYAGGLGPDHNVTVVRRGAPRQTTPADDPDAGSASLTEDDEDLRVAAFAERTLERVETMLADPRVHPTQARLLSEAADADQPKQIVDIAASSTLLAQAMDPGHGRYLGLVTALDDVDPQPHAYVAVGLFAVNSQSQLPGGVFVAAALPDIPDLTDRLVARSGADGVVATIADTWGGEVVPRALVAVAGVPRAPDRPAMPQPGLGRARWLAAGDAVSEQFSQELLVDGAPLASLVALGRLSDGAWATAHQTIDLPAPADPPRRAVAMLLGRTGERAPLVPRGLLTDGGVKAGGGTRYRIRLADLFGRFGDAAEIDAPDPERPLPPAPALQVEVVLDGPEGDEPGRVSPGRVVVRVPVPPIRDVATGSLPIAGAQLTLDGRSEVVSVAPGDPAGTVMLEHTFDLPELGQGETGESTLRATLIDGADRDGPSAETTVRFNDRRRPPTVVTGRGLIWTSRPGPSPEVELRLSWPAAANTRYRAYVADATSLGLTGMTRATWPTVGRSGTRARASAPATTSGCSATSRCPPTAAGSR